MRLPLLLVVFPYLITASNYLTPRDERISWKPCYEEGDPNIQCGRFEVPLDYDNPSVGDASLAVARYLATNKDEPKLGTLFLGPGGPGFSGIDSYILSQKTAKTIMDTVGGRYDLVSWDPRGSDYGLTARTVTHTRPRADCFDTAQEENTFWNHTVPRWGLEARGEFTRDEDINAFRDQVAPVDKLLETLGKKCNTKCRGQLKYMGTKATVQDLVALHDYLVGGDEDINFWGFSYGTVIGIYLVNMFKDRVGRVVLDGVVDPVYYANMPAHETWSIDSSSSDATLLGFLSECAKAEPNKCAFASDGSTVESLREKIIKLIIYAYDYKAEKKNAATFGSAQIRIISGLAVSLYHGMYTPTRWRGLAKDLESCWESFASKTTTPEKGCYSLIRNPSLQSYNKPPAYGLQAVTCADAVDAGDVETKDIFKKMIDVTKTVSPMFGPMWGAAGFYCHKWPVRAPNRYTGPWNSKLKNTILVIGNEADPITPFRSAQSVAHALGDSARLVQQDDYGHTSLAMHSDW
ncbi:hypothetical protein FRC07_011335 [Ceratobasidium sp. 392]|nr:hypothetical protein FRC07_011335 [Ceratobasidium sp. 392]